MRLQQRASLDLAHRQFSLAADDIVNKRWLHCVPRPVVPQAAYAGGPTVGQVGLPPNTLTESLPPLAKRGGGGGPAHAMCQGGCMQPYGRGDSCNVA